MPSDLTLYLTNGAVDVGVVVALVVFLVQRLKPLIERKFPPGDPSHDTVLHGAVLVLSLVFVTALQLAGPIGLQSGPAVVSLLTDTALAVIGAEGLYSSVRGKTPATPILPFVPAAPLAPIDGPAWPSAATAPVDVPAAPSPLVDPGTPASPGFIVAPGAPVDAPAPPPIVPATPADVPAAAAESQTPLVSS